MKNIVEIKFRLRGIKNKVIMKRVYNEKAGDRLSDKVKLKYEEEDLKLLAGFTHLDDDFMTVVFDRNIEATELVLSGCTEGI